MIEVRTIKIEELGKTHAVFFTREFEESWGYMGMRDYKTYDPTPRYGIEVVPYDKYTHKANGSDAGLVKRSFAASGFDKQMANRIWYNIEHGIHYEALRDAMKGNGYLTKEA